MSQARFVNLPENPNPPLNSIFAISNANVSQQTTLSNIFSQLPLTNTEIFVGNVNGIAVSVPLSGDATIIASGFLTISNDAITTIKIIDDAVTTPKIIDDAVTTPKIIDDAITTAKILDDNVTLAKLATNSVSTIKILDDNVTLAKLATNSVDSSKIVNDSIVNADINSAAAIAQSKLALSITDAEVDAAAAIAFTKLAALPSGNILVGNVSNEVASVTLGGDATMQNDGTLTIENGAVNTDKILNDAVTLAKLASGIAGNLISYDPSGDPVAVATGTAGQLLTSNGVGLAPTFQAAPNTGVITLNGDGTAAQVIAVGTGLAIADVGPTHTLSLNAASTDLTDTAVIARSTNNLSFFAATTSAQLAGVISDETGTGLLVFGTSPTIVTPTIVSFVNAVHNHQDAAGGGQLLSTAALSDTGNIAYLNTPNIYTAGNRQDFLGDIAGTAGLNVGGIAGNPTTQTDGDLWLNTSTNVLFARINGADVNISAPGEVFTWSNNHDANGFALEAPLFADPTDNTKQLAIDLVGTTAGILLTLDINQTTAQTLTIPNITAADNLVTDNVAATLTNKTLTTPTIGDYTNATHDHSNAANGGQLTNSALTSGVFGAITGVGTQTQALNIGTNFIDFSEIATPADPATDVGRLYVREIDATNTSIFAKLQRDGSIEEVDILASASSNVSVTTSNGDFSFLNVATEQTVVTVTDNINDVEITYNMENITLDTTVRVYETTNTNEVLISETVYSTTPANSGFTGDAVVILLNGKGENQRITFQSAGEAVTIPFARVDVNRVEAA